MIYNQLMGIYKNVGKIHPSNSRHPVVFSEFIGPEKFHDKMNEYYDSIDDEDAILIDSFMLCKSYSVDSIDMINIYKEKHFNDNYFDWNFLIPIKLFVYSIESELHKHYDDLKLDEYHYNFDVEVVGNKNDKYIEINASLLLYPL